jgi:ribosome-binding factor A
VGRRLLKINEGIREVVSQGLVELTDPRLGFITVTGVETTADLRHATVFVSVLGGGEQRAASLAAMRAAHGVLQGRLADTLRMKRTPLLAFEYDSTVDTAMRVESLIRRYEGELMEQSPDEQVTGGHEDANAEEDGGEEAAASAGGPS